MSLHGRKISLLLSILSHFLLSSPTPFPFLPTHLFFIVFIVLRIELRVLHKLGKNCTTELYPQPFYLLFILLILKEGFALFPSCSSCLHVYDGITSTQGYPAVVLFYFITLIHLMYIVCSWYTCESQRITLRKLVFSSSAAYLSTELTRSLTLQPL